MSETPNDRGLRRRAIFYAFKDFFPCGFTIDYAFLDEVLNFEFMPLLMVINLVITFSPYSLNDNALEKMANFKPRFVYLLDAVSKLVVCKLNSWSGLMGCCLAQKRFVRPTAKFIETGCSPQIYV